MGAECLAAQAGALCRSAAANAPKAEGSSLRPCPVVMRPALGAPPLPHGAPELVEPACADTARPRGREEGAGLHETPSPPLHLAAVRAAGVLEEIPVISKESPPRERRPARPRAASCGRHAFRQRLCVKRAAWRSGQGFHEDWMTTWVRSSPKIHGLVTGSSRPLSILRSVRRTKAPHADFIHCQLES